MNPSEVLSEINDYIISLPNNKLIVLCNEIYEWKYEVGELPEKSTFDSLCRKFNFQDRKTVQYFITREASRRYRRLVLLLMKDDPTCYLQQ